MSEKLNYYLMEGERDEARKQVADLTRDRDMYSSEMVKCGKLIEELQRENAELKANLKDAALAYYKASRSIVSKALLAERDALKAELDEASPMQTCARCGKQDRAHRMMIEEGDEWECEPCWERCEVQETQDARHFLVSLGRDHNFK